jgi:hypothetical protein
MVITLHFLQSCEQKKSCTCQCLEKMVAMTAQQHLVSPVSADQRWSSVWKHGHKAISRCLPSVCLATSTRHLWAEIVSLRYTAPYSRQLTCERSPFIWYQCCWNTSRITFTLECSWWYCVFSGDVDDFHPVNWHYICWSYKSIMFHHLHLLCTNVEAPSTDATKSWQTSCPPPAVLLWVGIHFSASSHPYLQWHHSFHVIHALLWQYHWHAKYICAHSVALHGHPLPYMQSLDDNSASLHSVTSVPSGTGNATEVQPSLWSLYTWHCKFNISEGMFTNNWQNLILAHGSTFNIAILS